MGRRVRSSCPAGAAESDTTLHCSYPFTGLLDRELSAVFTKSPRTRLLGVVLIVAIGVAIMASQNKPDSSIPMPDESVVELTIRHEGDTYKLVGGDLYKVC